MMQEYVSLIEKLAQGFAVLGQIPEIEYEYNPRQLLYQHDKIKLYHYTPRCKKPDQTPLLVVFATVNRPEILDLFPEHSFIGGLLENGSDVYLLDWGYPDRNDSHLSMNHYVNYVGDCVKFIKETTDNEKINLLGICQGGLISLSYAAITDDIKNLVLISTPIDFHTDDNTIATFLNRINVDDLIQLLGGNVLGSWLTQFFISLRPFELIGKKYLRFIDHVEDQAFTDRFIRVEKWLNDAPDQAGTAFAEFAHDYYRDNSLIKGNVRMNGKKVDLANLTMPILNVMAEEDEIIPVSASKVLKQYVGTRDYTQKIFPSGHIGIYVSEKVGKNLSKAISQWLKKR